MPFRTSPVVQWLKIYLPMEGRQEFEETLGVGEGQGSLVCCSLWDRKESDTTERLNNNSICLERKELRILEKEMATHSSILAWRIPRTEKPGGLQSMGSHRVGYD